MIKLIRKFFIVFAGKISYILIGLINIKVSTSILPPSEYGILGLIAITQSLLGLSIISPFGQFLNRHVITWKNSFQLADKLKQYTLILLISSVIGGFFLSFLLEKYFSSMILFSFGIVFFFNLYATTLIATFSSLSTCLGRQEIALKGTLISSLVSSALGILFVSFGHTSIWLFLGQTIGFIISLKIYSLLIRNLVYFDPFRLTMIDKLSFCSFSELKTYISPLLISTFLVWASNSGNRLIIERSFGLESLGFITLSLTISTQCWSLIETLISELLYPPFINYCSGSKSEAISFSQLINTTVPIFFVFLSFFLLISETLLSLLANESYGNASIFLIAGGTYEFFRMLTKILSRSAQINKKMKYSLPPSITSSCCSILFACFAIYCKQPIEITIFSLAVGSLVSFGVWSLIVYRKYRVSLDLRCILISSTTILFAIIYKINNFMMPQSSSITILTSVLVFTFGSFIIYHISKDARHVFKIVSNFKLT